MRVTELASKLRARGLTVVEVAGWQTRGNDFPARPDGALRHWTAGPKTGDTPSLNVVTNGRSDLPGPLCNVYQSRRVDARGLDIVYAVAAGKANHAGAGSWNGISGNYKLLGLEIEWAGPTEAFAGVRKRKLTSELVMRALLDCCTGTDTNDVAEHREYATPPGRKIDTNLDGNEMRRRMAELAGGGGAAPTPLPEEEDDMPRLLLKGDASNEWWITDGITKDHVEDKEHAAQLAFTGLVKWNNGAPFSVPQAMVNKIPLATVGDQIVWYTDTKEQGAHAYRVWGNIGKHLSSAADLNLLKFLGLREGNASSAPLGKEWKANVVLVDGPARNVPNDFRLQAVPTAAQIADAVKAILPSGSGGGITVEDVRAVLLKEFGFLKPGT